MRVEVKPGDNDVDSSSQAIEGRLPWNLNKV